MSFVNSMNDSDGHVRLMHMSLDDRTGSLRGKFLLQDDTGADSIFVRDLELLQGYTPLLRPKKTLVGNGASFDILGVGALSLLDDNGNIVTFFGVYFAPDCAGNFLGAIPMYDLGWSDRGEAGVRVWIHGVEKRTISFVRKSFGFCREIDPIILSEEKFSGAY